MYVWFQITYISYLRGNVIKFKIKMSIKIEINKTMWHIGELTTSNYY